MTHKVGPNVTAGQLGWNAENWLGARSPEELEGLQELYRKSVINALSDEVDYEVHAQSQDADIHVSASLLELRPLAPKDDFKHRGAFDEYVSQGAGSAKIKLVISVDGEPLLEEIEVRDAGYQWGRNNRFNNMRDVRRMFSMWGHDVVELIVEAQEGS